MHHTILSTADTLMYFLKKRTEIIYEFVKAFHGASFDTSNITVFGVGKFTKGDYI